MTPLSDNTSAPLESIPSRLHRGEGGCWFASTAGAISYPSEGNETCFAVEDGSLWFQHRNSCLVSLIRRLPPPGTLFDVGGGNGVVASAIQRAGFEVVLVEPGLHGALNARKRGVESVVCARLEDAGFPAAPFRPLACSMSSSISRMMPCFFGCWRSS